MQSFVIALLICSVSMSALALIYLALTPLLAKRYSATGRYYTWLVVVIGLIIPFRPQWGVNIIHVDVPGKTAAALSQIGSRLGNQLREQLEMGQLVNSPPAAVALPAENAVFAPAVAGVSWWQIAALVWLAGFIVFLAYHIIKHRRFAKMVNRWSENMADGRPFAVLQSLKNEMGILRPIGLYQCSSIGSPMLTGLIKPRILLPKTAFAQDELRFILKHELVHYKRKDLYYKCSVLLATAIHWFNPLVYLMARAIGRQCELSCDAETVRSADVLTRRQYSETILALLKYRSKLNTALSTSFNGGRNGLKKRILSIMDMGTKKAGLVIFIAALIITLGEGLAAYSPSHDPSYGTAPVLFVDDGSAAAVVGDIIQLGGLDWRVLEVKQGQALVLSDKILFKMAYQAPLRGQEFVTANTTWAECDLRQYLNGQFYDSAFSVAEKESIVETTLTNSGNPWYKRAGGDDAVDKVFLLSMEEIVRYFGYSGETGPLNSGTTFINDQYNAGRIAETLDARATWWWSRSPGAFYSGCSNLVLTAAVSAVGGLAVFGDYVTNESGGVRPALWLKL